MKILCNLYRFQFTYRDMRYIIIIGILFLFSAPLVTQAQHIDSIVIDESKGILSLHGKFGITHGFVFIDSVIMPIQSWSDSLIGVYIPDTGKGSSGWVQVSKGANISNQKLLTYVHFQVFNAWNDPKDVDYPAWRFMNADTINVRADFADMVPTSKYVLFSSASSRYHDLNNDGACPMYNNAGILHAQVLYDVANRQFNYPIPYCNYGGKQELYMYNVSLDKNFTPIGYIWGSWYDSIFWGSIAPTNFPPQVAGVHEVESNQNILNAYISPNPVVDNTEIIITLHDPMSMQMDVINVLGQVVFSKENILLAGVNKMSINSSSLSSGIYVCRLKAGEEFRTLRFIKD